MGFKTFVARMSLARASHRMKQSPLRVPLEVEGKTILVLLPERQKELTEVKQILPEISELFGNTDVYLMSCPTVEIQSIFPRKGFRIISPTRSAMTWYLLPENRFLEKLREHKFDFILDTNLEENLFAAKVLLSFPDAIRIGCQGHLGPPFINLEVKTKYLRDRRMIYRAMLEVVGRLTQINNPQTS
jgi:hypothetical protein